MLQASRSLLVLVLGIAALLFLPGLFQQGLFVDGLTYASISRNLAEGLGDFFNPYYTHRIYPVFNEHPPLVFGVQSLLFHLFGDYFWVEKLYCLLLLGIHFFLIKKIYSRLFPSSYNSWLAMLLFISTPLVLWSFRANILELSMSTFCLGSVLFGIKAMQEKKHAYFLIAALFCVASFLSKGPTGMFPLVLPLLYFLLIKPVKMKKLIQQQLLFLIYTFGLIGLSFAIFPELLDNIIAYLNQQLAPALAGKREITTSSRFLILFNLLKAMAIPLAICLLLYLFNRKFASLKLDSNQKLLLLIALSASLPLMISLKQRPFYLIPSIPFYAMFLASLIGKLNWLKVLEKRQFLIKSIGLVLILISVGLSALNFAKPGRDLDMLELVAKHQDKVPEGSRILIRKSDRSNYKLHAYIMRYLSASLVTVSADADHILVPLNAERTKFEIQKIPSNE